jgi:hypothetical protein
MTAAELMTQGEAEAYMRMIDPTIHLSSSTWRIVGTYKDLPIVYAHNANWRRAMDNMCTRTPEFSARGCYQFD